MLVQIYEVQTPEEAVALARLGVDHIGVLVGDGLFPRELAGRSGDSDFRSHTFRIKSASRCRSPPTPRRWLGWSEKRDPT